MEKVHSQRKLKSQLKHIMAQGTPYLPVERCYPKKYPELNSLQHQIHNYLGTLTLRKFNYKNYTKIEVKTHLKEWEKMMKELYGVFIPKVVNYTQPILVATKIRANNTFVECGKAV